MDSAIIIYHSYSGNTEETAELIQEALVNNDYKVDLYRIDSGTVPELSSYKLCLIGTFTWDKGMLPEEVEDFIDFNTIPENVGVFGTGDTQFGGDELFCKAAERASIKCRAKYIPLKIEQSPRGTQEYKVLKWVSQIVKINNTERKM